MVKPKFKKLEPNIKLESNIGQHKPHLVWFGAILGMDLFIDIHNQPQAEDKVLMAQKIMMKAFDMTPPKENDNA